MVVAIDGPSGVGKSTVARRVSAALGIPYLETGAMYRALGFEVERSGTDPGDQRAVERLADRLDERLVLDERGDIEVLLDGKPLSDRVRSPEIAEVTSRISAYAGVRRVMAERQRAAAMRFGGVIEGRDIGTKVFPETPFKFYLDADSRVRARRRYEELVRSGERVSFEEVAAEMTRRDDRDTRRSASPLMHDESYTLIDTSGMSAEEVAEAILSSISAGAASDRSGNGPSGGHPSS